MKKNRKAPTLADVGEDALVARLVRGLPGARGLKIGPGDDCAVIAEKGAPLWTLFKTDCVVEGIHFTADTDFARVGWKAMARALSDIAAMGGLPEYALVTVALPRDLPLAQAEALYAGLRKCAQKFGVAIAGGETSRSLGTVFVNVALTGWVEKRRCVLRSGGKPGDRLFVTGRLGGSLKTGKHLDFFPRVQEARWLVERFPVHAMMDLSDGLAADLPRLARASRCGFVLEEAALPLTPGCTRKEALHDGEDYELLFAVSAQTAARLQRDWPFAKLPLTCIGALTKKLSKTAPALPHGFDHFA